VLASQLRVLGVEGGFFGRKIACNSKNSQIGVGKRLINSLVREKRLGVLRGSVTDYFLNAKIPDFAEVVGDLNSPNF
jgi:hypothetical protein